MGTDCVYPHIERYANNGSVLDLGCGPGTTGSELNDAVYQRYTGVDISDVAIHKATSRDEQTHRITKNDYIHADISRYVPSRQHNVILFGDVLYYLPRRNIIRTLTRYSQYLTPRGVLVVKLNGMPKHYPIIEKIEEAFDTVERHFYPPDVCIVVLRRRASSPSRLPHPIS
jgi:trans-aconitate methyltransferase